MGVMDNIKKIFDYQKDISMERRMNREVVVQSIVETTFYEKYSSFVYGLRDRLTTLLVDQNYKEVIFKPNTPDHAKYFERAMEDPQFTAMYKIKRTLGGEYTFEQKTMDDIELDFDIEKVNSN